MIKKGFTLAEVLITLAILGVVAALTIPGLLANTQGRQYSVGYKKAVSTFGQAINKMVAMEGVDMSNWNEAVQYDGTPKYENFVDFMEQNFNVQKVAGDADVYLSDGTAFRGVGNIPQGDGAGGGGCTAENPCVIVVDTNGDAGPNRQTDMSGSNGAPKVNDQFFMVITDVAAFPASNNLKDPDSGNTINVIGRTALGCGTNYCKSNRVTADTAEATTFVMTGSTANSAAR